MNEVVSCQKHGIEFTPPTGYCRECAIESDIDRIVDVAMKRFFTHSNSVIRDSLRWAIEKARKELTERSLVLTSNPAPAYQIEEHKMLTFSAAHITESDNELLKQGQDAVVSYPYQYGYFIYLSDDVNEKDLREAGFSWAFIRIYFDVRDKGAHYLQLDRDGPVYDDYAKFDW